MVHYLGTLQTNNCLHQRLISSSHKEMGKRSALWTEPVIDSSGQWSSWTYPSEVYTVLGHQIITETMLHSCSYTKTRTEMDHSGNFSRSKQRRPNNKIYDCDESTITGRMQQGPL